MLSAYFYMTDILEISLQLSEIEWGISWLPKTRKVLTQSCKQGLSWLNHQPPYCLIYQYLSLKNVRKILLRVFVHAVNSGENSSFSFFSFQVHAHTSLFCVSFPRRKFLLQPDICLTEIPTLLIVYSSIIQYLFYIVICLQACCSILSHSSLNCNL